MWPHLSGLPPPYLHTEGPGTQLPYLSSEGSLFCLVAVLSCDSDCGGKVFPHVLEVDGRWGDHHLCGCVCVHVGGGGGGEKREHILNSMPLRVLPYLQNVLPRLSLFSFICLCCPHTSLSQSHHGLSFRRGEIIPLVDNCHRRLVQTNRRWSRNHFQDISVHFCKLQ